MIRGGPDIYDYTYYDDHCDNSVKHYSFKPDRKLDSALLRFSGTNQFIRVAAVQEYERGAHFLI